MRWDAFSASQRILSIAPLNIRFYKMNACCSEVISAPSVFSNYVLLRSIINSDLFIDIIKLSEFHSNVSIRQKSPPHFS